MKISETTFWNVPVRKALARALRRDARMHGVSWKAWKLALADAIERGDVTVGKQEGYDEWNVGDLRRDVEQ